MDYRIVKQVHRKRKPFTRALKNVMIVMCVLFILAGIIADRGMLFLALLMAGMYFIYEAYSEKDYEYTIDGNSFTIVVIYGKRRRKTAHELDLKDIEVVAPSWHEAVAKYRKDMGTEKIQKFDYTSYEDEIPYYTMIILENKRKIKLLLDLDENMLQYMKRKYPQKIIMEAVNVVE